MKWTAHPFGYDTVEFTWRDLLQLVLGRPLRDGALIAIRGGTANAQELGEKGLLGSETDATA